MNTPPSPGAPAAETSPPPAPMSPPPAAPSLLGPILWFLVGILSVVSAFVAWWTESASGITISFLPGSSFTVSGSGMSITDTYAEVGAGQVGGLYEAIYALALVGGILALLGGILSIVWARRSHGAGTNWGKGLALGGWVLILVNVIIGPALQPWAIKQGTSGICSSSGTTPCSGFWGSASGVSWAASTGWYLALGAFILGIIAMVLARRMRGSSASM